MEKGKVYKNKEDEQRQGMAKGEIDKEREYG